ncbi:MAG: YbaK/EbsC family protein [Candidatus Rokubacteria bacterium]|nr:YbaK/EbsC family protein [Candidatus Rokubacteria bacterium]
MPTRGFSDSIFFIGFRSLAVVSETETPETSSSAVPPLSAAAQKVQDALTASGFPYSVMESPVETRTAKDAARLVKCDVAQIAKSLIFKSATGKGVLVITSGANQVNEFRIGMLLKEALEKAPASFVRQQTGFAVGGIPPLAHTSPMETFIDEDLLKQKEIWAAGGTANALFKLLPADLVKMTGGRVVKVT